MSVINILMSNLEIVLSNNLFLKILVFFTISGLLLTADIILIFFYIFFRSKKVLILSVVITALFILLITYTGFLVNDFTVNQRSLSSPISNKTSENNNVITPEKCPEYINCMPGPGLKTPCKVPKECQGKTQIAQ